MLALFALVAGVAAVLGVEQIVPDWPALRQRMVDQQMLARGIDEPRVLTALRRVPRHLFVPPDVQPRAYEDMPLPIGFGQTISQPYIVAFMTATLEPKPTDRVLEIGTGSGYQAAVLAELVQEVYTIEIVEPLLARAAATLKAQRHSNVHTRLGNGYLGWPDAAPFTKIIVTAAPERIPDALVVQLAVGGLMVVPVGRQDVDGQQLTLIRKTASGIVTRDILSVRFVPMIQEPPR